MRSFLVSALVCLAFVARGLASPGPGDHEDARLGFRMSTPRGWEPIAQNVEERWIVGKYLSDKTDHFTDKSNGYTFSHKPDLTIIAFVAEAVRERESVVEKKGKDGEKQITVTLVNPFKDYMDFMKRRYTGGGFFKTSEEEIQVGDVRTTCIEIKVDKGSNEGPKRITTWIYHLQDVDVAVQFETLEDAYPKLQSEFQRCLKSFKPIPRTVGKLFEGPSTAGAPASFSEIEKMSPEERKQYRQGLEKQAHERATETAPRGWNVSQIGRFLVINHSDEKFAKSTVADLEAQWKWLDATFGFLGEREYVRSPILRVCKDWPEMETYFKEGVSRDSRNLEIVTCPDRPKSEEEAFTRWLNVINNGMSTGYQMMSIWFRDRDPNTWQAMPAWLAVALEDALTTGRVKAGKLVYKLEDWERDRLREEGRKQDLTGAKDLMLMSSESFSGLTPRLQADALVQLYLSDAASKNKKMKDLLPTYMRNLAQVARAIDQEEEAAQEGKKATAAKTEEEEDAQYKEKGQRYKRIEKRLLEETLNKTFEGWSKKDWDLLETAYGEIVG